MYRRVCKLVCVINTTQFKSFETSFNYGGVCCSNQQWLLSFFRIAWILKDIKFICDIFVLFCMYLCYFFFFFFETYCHIFMIIDSKIGHDILKIFHSKTGQTAPCISQCTTYVTAKLRCGVMMVLAKLLCKVQSLK